MDGGQSWESTETPGYADCKISFADAKTGWVFSNAQLRATADGGATWNEIALPEGVLQATAISLRTADAGYLLTSDGYLYVTKDGGESWSSLVLDLTGYEDMSLLPATLPAAAIRFFDAQEGVVAVSLVGGGKNYTLALRTVDGGQTWKQEVIPIDVGVPYLTRDGKFLTMNSFLNSGRIFVARYKGD
jgi:photosystem II stability/assembly factor-like uncharacterized protein